MTPDQMKQARQLLGLSANGLAQALRLGSNGGRTVRRWEAGEIAISGPVQVAIELMTEKYVDFLNKKRKSIQDKTRQG